MFACPHVTLIRACRQGGIANTGVNIYYFITMIYASRCGERGNVLFLILIAVALFAALAYAITSSSRSSTSSVTAESAKATASEILSYANSLRNAVMRLEISNGCEIKEINFQNTVDTGYTALYPRSDKSCDMFSSTGGNLSWVKANPNWFIPQAEASSGAYASYESGAYGRFYFSNSVCVTNVGTGDCPTGGAGNELVFGLHFLKREICQAFNELGNQIMADTGVSILGKPDGGNRYRGNFNASSIYINNSGEMMGCGKTTKTGYTFYYVLKAR